ncbi:TetR/AcrR family transcriptional regulator [Shewanella holmiensis]|uniref:TetR/AcrR family transcriptional regulator n=1 Tax=Shewanella holmiensis TaxID=2952222 RepID=A0A9X2WM94_9GAMM|nr:TetR/AcrR family transcriptional regulator [Shewanella holmiensis]MCT7941741.1 TetR/AcrR family transcriptional regulator [Shewanella holmiensis]
MSSWEQRGDYLVKVSLRCLKGHKTFNLCRSHLVQASQISKGTIYNHFTSEADLIVAVGSAQFEQWLAQAKADDKNYPDPYQRFIFHHCQRLYVILSEQDFVMERVLPNETLLNNCSDIYRQRYLELKAQAYQWNADTMQQIGHVAGFDRLDLVINYLRGALINIDDSRKRFDDPKLYYQFSYALTQLMGHSSKRIPTESVFTHWIAKQSQTEH